MSRPADRGNETVGGEVDEVILREGLPACEMYKLHEDREIVLVELLASILDVKICNGGNQGVFDEFSFAAQLRTTEQRASSQTIRDAAYCRIPQRHLNTIVFMPGLEALNTGFDLVALCVSGLLRALLFSLSREFLLAHAKGLYVRCVRHGFPHMLR